MELFCGGRVSIDKACALLPVLRGDALAQRADNLRITYFLINNNDWAAELATVEAWRQWSPTRAVLALATPDRDRPHGRGGKPGRNSSAARIAADD